MWLLATLFPHTSSPFFYPEVFCAVRFLFTLLKLQIFALCSLALSQGLQIKSRECGYTRAIWTASSHATWEMEALMGHCFWTALVPRKPPQCCTGLCLSEAAGKERTCAQWLHRRDYCNIVHVPCDGGVLSLCDLLCSSLSYSGDNIKTFFFTSWPPIDP